MCFVEADALSASWQKRRLTMRICMHEVIIHISTCSTLPWQQASPHGGWNLVLSFFCFLFSSEAFRFGKWDISYEEILSKRKSQKQNLLLSADDSHSYKILMQNLNHNSPCGKKWLMGNIHISCFQIAYPPSSHNIKINSRSNECHWSWLQYSVLD